MQAERRARFERDGFFIFEGILDAEILERLRQASDASLGEQEAAHFAEQVATGSMILIDGSLIDRYPAFSELVAYPRVLEALASLGFPDPKFGHGRIISKPPHSPPLFWHEDGRFWNDPVSYTPLPIQCFLMFYLTDTTAQNGCLRAVPGSHLKRHPLHDRIPAQRTNRQVQYEAPDDPSFARADGEIDVPLRAGDFVIGYGSLLHAAHGNRSATRRTCLTMWYYPAYPDLPERTQASVAAAETRARAPGHANPDVAARLAPLAISYAGDAQPIAQNLIPGLR